MTGPEDARRALQALSKTQAGMADRLTPNWSYGLAYGAVCGLIVGGQGAPQPWAILSVVLGVSGLAVLTQLWKTRTGFWVNGLAPKRARWAAVGLLVVMVGLMGFNIWHGRAHGGWIVPLATGGAAGIAAMLAGEIWMRVLRREMKADGE